MTDVLVLLVLLELLSSHSLMFYKRLRVPVSWEPLFSILAVLFWCHPQLLGSQSPLCHNLSCHFYTCFSLLCVVSILHPHSNVSDHPLLWGGVGCVAEASCYKFLCMNEWAYLGSLHYPKCLLNISMECSIAACYSVQRQSVSLNNLLLMSVLDIPLHLTLNHRNHSLR